MVDSKNPVIKGLIRLGWTVRDAWPSELEAMGLDAEEGTAYVAECHKPTHQFTLSCACKRERVIPANLKPPAPKDGTQAKQVDAQVKKA